MGESRLRVLALVTDAFGGHGGIAQYNRDLLSSLAQSEQVQEVIVLPRLAVTMPGTLPPGLRQLPAVHSRIAYSLAAVRLWRANRPIDVVFCGHVFMAPLAALLAKLLRARLWVQVHGVDAWQELSPIYRRCIEVADLVTSVSRYTRRRFLKWCGINPTRVKVLPNTVDPRYQPGPRPGYLIERHALHGKKVLLTVSRLASAARHKGHDRVIRILPKILAKHPETVYLIVGDGDDRPRLEALAAELRLGKAARFAGQVAPHELPDYFRLADVFVMPSTGEGFGIVFLEAMASGIHVIGGNRDGSLDALGDGALAMAVDPESEDAVSSAICAALANPAGHVNCTERFKPSFFAEHLNRVVKSHLDRCAMAKRKFRPVTG
jgi:phosphatidyl-myo-inositol dimannoside synthase